MLRNKNKKKVIDKYIGFKLEIWKRINDNRINILKKINCLKEIIFEKFKS